jgi:hypothetical protein
VFYDDLLTIYFCAKNIQIIILWHINTYANLCGSLVGGGALIRPIAKFV